MDKKINEILAGTKEKDHLLKTLELELKDTNLLNEVVVRAERMLKDNCSDLEICDSLTNFVYENMPVESKCEFYKEIDYVLENYVLPRLSGSEKE